MTMIFVIIFIVLRRLIFYRGNTSLVRIFNIMPLLCFLKTAGKPCDFVVFRTVRHYIILCHFNSREVAAKEARRAQPPLLLKPCMAQQRMPHKSSYVPYDRTHREYQNPEWN